MEPKNRKTNNVLFFLVITAFSFICGCGASKESSPEVAPNCNFSMARSLNKEPLSQVEAPYGYSVQVYEAAPTSECRTALTNNTGGSSVGLNIKTRPSQGYLYGVFLGEDRRILFSKSVSGSETTVFLTGNIAIKRHYNALADTITLSEDEQKLMRDMQLPWQNIPEAFQVITLAASPVQEELLPSEVYVEISQE